MRKKNELSKSVVLARARRQRWRQSPKGRRWKKVYQKSAYMREARRKWRKTERGRAWFRENAARKRELVRHAVYKIYGSRCQCCGEREMKFLTLDHANGEGAKHRRKMGLSKRASWYVWVLRHEPKYIQLLCCNCNFGRSRNGGTCPHKKGGSHVSNK